MKKRVTSLAVFLALTAIGIGGIPVTADDNNGQGGYLALGDSVPFGFSPLIPAAQRADPNVFVGYPEAFAALHDLTVTNLSCPGETSGSMVSSTNPDNGCRRYRSRFALHAAYSGPQLGYAVAFLQSHPSTELVSISIGHNDLLLLEKACNNVETCEFAALPGMLAQLAQNLKTIYTQIRAAGYEGSLIAVTYHARNYRDRTEVSLISAVDKVLTATTREFDGPTANGFRAFRKEARQFDGDSCAAGLLIVLSQSPRTCDFHPSTAGRDVLVRTMRNALD